MAQIKAVVADIDGTLTDMRRLVGTDAIAAIRALPVPVVLASGNVICFMRAAAKLIGASDAMIGENGGVVQVGYDAQPAVLADIDACRRAAALLQKEYPGLEQLDARYRMSELAFRRGIDAGQAMALIAGEFPELEVVDTRFALHLKHRGVNKGTGLAEVARRMGLAPGEFAALGDSANDLPMFGVAGLGLAVGNATREIKDAADFVAEKPYGEGAAEALNWLARRL